MTRLFVGKPQAQGGSLYICLVQLDLHIVRLRKAPSSSTFLFRVYQPRPEMMRSAVWTPISDHDETIYIPIQDVNS